MEVFVQFFFISVRYAISWIVNLIKIAIILLIILFLIMTSLFYINFCRKKNWKQTKKFVKLTPLRAGCFGLTMSNNTAKKNR